MTRLATLLTLTLVLLAACGDDERPVSSPLDGGESPRPVAEADVLGVEVSGDTGAYSFSVTVASPDTGCEQYADWWEVVTLEGELVYRRMSLHSHVTEQPFTRSGGPATIGADDEVVVRAHTNTGGYGGQTLRGSVVEGFEVHRPEARSAAALASSVPLPERCDF